MNQFRHIAPQSVQAIEGRTPAQIEAAARARGDRYVAVPLAACRDKQAVLDAIARAFGFPDWFGANLDALYDCLTDLAPVAGKGYVIVLERIPTAHGFDADAREALLDAFRDAAEFHAEMRLPFRVFYSFA